MELKLHIWISVSLFDAMKLINIVQRNIFAARWEKTTEHVRTRVPSRGAADTWGLIWSGCVFWLKKSNIFRSTASTIRASAPLWSRGGNPRTGSEPPLQRSVVPSVWVEDVVTVYSAGQRDMSVTTPSNTEERRSCRRRRRRRARLLSQQQVTWLEWI